MDSADLAILERETAELTPDLGVRELRLRAERIINTAKRLQTQIEEQLASLGVLSPNAKGERLVAELKAAEGGAYSGAELGQKFKLTPAVLHRRRREHRVVYWRDAQHEYFYPRWQFNEAGALLPGIQEVLQTFKSQDEWRVMRYFLGPRKQLRDRRPLDLLRAAEVEAVVIHARAHAAKNTW